MWRESEKKNTDHWNAVLMHYELGGRGGGRDREKQHRLFHPAVCWGKRVRAVMSKCGRRGRKTGGGGGRREEGEEKRERD